MSTDFPIGLDAFAPVPKSQNVEVKHRVRHQNVEDAVEAIETKVGINGSADVNSLDYKVAQVAAIPGNLAAATGSSLVGYQQLGTGSVPRTVLAKLRERVSFEDYGAVGDGVADDTAAIQAAINANPGKDIFATKSAYKISASINILTAVRLHAPPGGAEIRQSTVNTDHIMIGNGTLAGKGSSLGTEIEGFTFVPNPGVANFTTGSCIFVNYSANLKIQDCRFYGKDGGGVTRLFRGITMLSCAISTVRHCQWSFMRDSHIFTSGVAGLEGRTVDVHFESCYLATGGNHSVWLFSNSAGIFLSDCTILDVGGFDALRIDSDPVTEQGTNFFINNINIEGGNYANGRGIAVMRGGVVQVIGGWVGGIINTQPSVLVNAPAGNVEFNGLRVDFGYFQIDGPSVSVKTCEITGDNATNTVGINITNGANDYLIAACRIKQFTTSAIAIGGAPARGVITGIASSNIGGGIITGAGYADGPSITAIRSNASSNATSAATITLDYGRDGYQVTGTTPNITDINPKCPGRRIIVQAGTGGITLSAAGAVILLKGGAATVTIPQFRTIELFCDGINWFEIGGNY